MKVSWELCGPDEPVGRSRLQMASGIGKLHALLLHEGLHCALHCVNYCLQSIPNVMVLPV